MQTTQTHLTSVRKLIAIATIGFALVAASPAEAADTTPADSQYGAVLGEQSGGSGGQGGLPFTGLNLVVVNGARCRAGGSRRRSSPRVAAAGRQLTARSITHQGV